MENVNQWRLRTLCITLVSLCSSITNAETILITGANRGLGLEHVIYNTLLLATPSSVQLANAMIPNLKLSQNPRIVNISSRMGIISKAALNMVTKQLAVRLSSDGIIVISMGPGHNRTDMGGKNAPLSPQESVPLMIKLIASLEQSQSGRFWYHDGTELPW